MPALSRMGVWRAVSLTTHVSSSGEGDDLLRGASATGHQSRWCILWRPVPWPAVAVAPHSTP